MRLCSLLSLLPLGLLAGWSSGCGSEPTLPDPVAAQALAGCEAPASRALEPSPTMLPGSACLNCHQQDGQAGDPGLRWTIAGTVFSSPTAGCSTEGVSGAIVEILRMDGTLQMTLRTNSVGNFYSGRPITFPLRARVKLGTTVKEMMSLQATGGCASCHSNPASGGAPGRLYLN